MGDLEWCRPPFIPFFIIFGVFTGVTLIMFILNRIIAKFKITFSYFFFSVFQHIAISFLIDGIGCIASNEDQRTTFGVIFVSVFGFIAIFSLIFLHFWFCDLAFPSSKSSKNCSFFHYLTKGPILTRTEFEIMLARIQATPPIFGVKGEKHGYLPGTTKMKIRPFVEFLDFQSWADGGSFVRDSKKALSVVQIKILADLSDNLRNISDSRGKALADDDDDFTYRAPAVYIQDCPEWFLLTDETEPFIYSLYHNVLFRFLLGIFSIFGFLLTFHAIFSFFLGKTKVKIRKSLSDENNLKNRPDAHDDSIFIQQSTHLLNKFVHTMFKNSELKNKLLFPALLKIPEKYVRFIPKVDLHLIDPDTLSLRYISPEVTQYIDNIKVPLNPEEQKKKTTKFLEASPAIIKTEKKTEESKSQQHLQKESSKNQPLPKKEEPTKLKTPPKPLEPKNPITPPKKEELHETPLKKDEPKNPITPPKKEEEHLDHESKVSIGQTIKESSEEAFTNKNEESHQ